MIPYRREGINMKIQVLVATMYQDEGVHSLLDRINLQSDAVVVNQCDRDKKYCFKYNGYDVLWIDSTDRGLSNSRNLALSNANAEICVICDDDEILTTGYPVMIDDAYMAIPEADVIAFNIERIGWSEAERLFVKPQKIGRFKTYSSVHITFRRTKVQEKHIVFDTRFGAGSKMYSSSEDAIFCMDCHKSKLKMYTSPGVLCSVNCENSTWFNGYNEKYFFDVGAYLSATFPRLKNVLKWYYPLRCGKLSELSWQKIICAINEGVQGYKKQYNYAQYQIYKASAKFQHT